MQKLKIESPRSNAFQGQSKSSSKSDPKLIQNQQPQRQWRFSQIFQLSPIKQKDQDEESSLQSKQNPRTNFDTYNLSPIRERLPRHPIVLVDDYEKYLQRLGKQQEQDRPSLKSQKVTHSLSQKAIRNKKSLDKVKINQDDNKNKKINIEINNSNLNNQKKFKRKVLPSMTQEKLSLKKLNFQSMNPQDEEIFQNIFRTNQTQLQKSIKNINAFEKKIICFYCGGPHYANQCFQQDSNSSSLSQQRCLNCKKLGHTAKFCTQQWRCIICQSNQHMAKQCPKKNTNSFEQRKCFNCNETGHFARQCQKKIKCFKCNQYGHQKKDCPLLQRNPMIRTQQFDKRDRTCFNCKKTGHYANQCDQPIICHRCGEFGHYARECPDISQSFESRLQNYFDPQFKNPAFNNFSNFNPEVNQNSNNNQKYKNPHKFNRK